ncbi:flavin-containing monooxygenase 5-like isoform X2 [Pithys albifrons albifrons]|uniref:flavin-containing monooxygenase 5-like isoform X2 n=1 Tax=Pithys albifrons albifrons TaxID=3385563 RepID=UPI003A5CB3BE
MRKQICSVVPRGCLAMNVPGASCKLWIHLVCASCCRGQRFPNWSHHPGTSDTLTAQCISHQDLRAPELGQPTSEPRLLGTLCQHSQPRGTGGVGDAVLGATGCHWSRERRVCPSRINRAGLIPAVPGAKVEGSACLLGTHTPRGSVRVCSLRHSGTAAHPEPRLRQSLSRKSRAGRRQPAGSRWPRGRSDGREAPLSAAAHRTDLVVKHNMAKRVAIIGGGSSGLCAIKACLQEGLEPVCFERTRDIGGLWRFEEHPEDGRASIYRSVIINTSKEMMCFSDFPIPEDFPNYMHNSKIMEYFRMYAQHFDLLRHIRFRTSVCRVSKRPDFATTGQWEVVTESEGKQEAAVFDAVLVCSGHHTDAHLPLNTFPGIEKFKGRYLHSRDYKDPQDFRDKKVVVIGIGNSGSDLAVEISQTAQQVFLSTRRGAWILNRVGDQGYPIDTILTTRMKTFLQELLSPSLACDYMEKKLNARFDHMHYGLKPKHRVINQHPTVNDDLPNRIISGRVRVKPNIQEFTETSAIFEDGTREDIDVVVFATGYSFSFPFLEGCVKVVENQLPLYKFVFPPDLEKPTLAFIGLIQPLGAIMPISELQCRWATRVFKGLNKLPPRHNMDADIKQKKEIMAKRYVKSQRHTIQVDYIPYMDELACQLGVKPNLLTLFLTDPKLAMEVLFGPCTPYQYRLRGPGAWAGARKAILTQQQRIIKPLQTRHVEECSSRPAVPLIFKLVGAVAVLAAVFAYF